MPTRLVCAFDNLGIYYPLNNYSFIISENIYSIKFLLGLLNSKLMNWYFKNSFIDYNIKPKYIEQLPLTKTDSNKYLEEKVDEILAIKKDNPLADTSVLEREIDWMVYGLYGLSEEEIKIVEES